MLTSIYCEDWSVVIPLKIMEEKLAQNTNMDDILWCRFLVGYYFPHENCFLQNAIIISSNN